jgi:hypothetical protein
MAWFFIAIVVQWGLGGLWLMRIVMEEWCRDYDAMSAELGWPTSDDLIDIAHCNLTKFMR